MPLTYTTTKAIAYAPIKQRKFERYRRRASRSRNSLAMFQEAQRKKLRGAAEAGGGLIVANAALKSGLPRIAGVRLERHSTSKGNARKIMQSGGWLDPSYGGTGAAQSVNNPGFIKNSKGYVHVTGYHPDNQLINSNNALRNVALRKVQGVMYRGVSGANLSLADDSPFKILGTVAKNNILGKSKTFYIPGSDEYFKSRFIPDVDDLALKSQDKIKVYGNRYSATLGQIKKEGLLKSMGANKGRVLAGAALLGGGGTLSYNLAKSGLNSLGVTKVKAYKDKNGKIVKSHTRKK
jgi:hypothetical protein